MITNKPNKIIIHCSATVEGKNFYLQDIKNWHIQRGFYDIGYHFLIYLNGEVEPARPANIIGAHCKGHNSNSIGICYIGGLNKNKEPKDTRTKEQKKSLKSLIKGLQEFYNIPNNRIYGHNDFSTKDCPCFNVKDEVALW